jgi:hypothetical protein
VSTAPATGQLVVVPAQPAWGVGRLERVVDDEGGRFARVFFYEDGRIENVPLAEVEPAPPGPWPKDRAEG